MNFFSLTFVGAVAGALLLYYLVPGRFRWCVLLCVSFAFYVSGGWKAGLFLLFTAWTNYMGGRLLSFLNELKGSLTPEQKKEKEPWIKTRKRLVLVLDLLLNFGLLFGVKYWNFTAQAIGNVSGWNLPRLDLIMPVGLSFYMFQSVGYVVDCYRGKYKAEKNFFKFTLFVSFFPQMVQGPISRYDQLQPQLLKGNSWDSDKIKEGIQLALWGYLKRMLLADRAAMVVNGVFDAPEKFGGFFYAFGVLFYCIQLYCDFSGGIDITRGVAKLFGIDLAENFKRPFFATTLADYWRRWHITLGSWMRDYVFYPLSFSKPFANLGRWARKRFKGKVGKVIPT
ncbi:MAG: MBOAT family protein, partial [Oscillospiraceae bacterium]|nr:MBOAT family protein [Oscillospiraceae bacterium]